MNISKDINGIYYLKWDGIHHGIDHKITDLNDPRCEMNFEVKTGDDGKKIYYYGVVLGMEPSKGIYLKPYIEMTKTWLKMKIANFEGGENKNIIMKKKKDGLWSAHIKSMIRITI